MAGERWPRWLVACLVVLPWVAEAQTPPEWLRTLDASRYLLTEAERPKQQATAGAVRISEPAYLSDFAEKDYRNPNRVVLWTVRIEQTFTNPADPSERVQVTITVFERPLYAAYEWRMVHRRTGEDTRSAIDDFYANGPGPTPDRGGSRLVGNLWISVGGNWKRYRDAYAAALLAKHDRPRRVRALAVTAYDGSDHRHLPLTFWVEVSEDGNPLAGEPVELELVGEVRCLADRWAWWDSSERRWVETGDFSPAFNAIDGTAAPRTDGNGRVIVRFFLDFGRIRNMNVPLPQRIGVKASIDSGNPEDAERVTGGATMMMRHGAFVRGIYYSPPGGPLVPLAVLEEARSRALDPDGSWQERWVLPAGQEIVRREGVHDRVTIGRGERLPEDVVFERPDFYLGVPTPEARLLVDARPDEEPRSRSYLPTGSGIGVQMLWLDGTEGIFMVHAPGVLDAMISGVPNRSMTTGSQSVAHVVHFLIGQGVDVLVRSTVVGAATALGGPVAGVYAFIIFEGKDIVEAHEGYLLENAHLVMLRSEVAVTTGEGGVPVLHVFEGSPGVVGADGTETVVTDGQSLDLLPGGAVGTVREAAASPRAVAMRDALRTMGPPRPDALQAMAPPARRARDASRGGDAHDGGATAQGNPLGRLGGPVALWMALLAGTLLLFAAAFAVAVWWWLRRSSRTGSHGTVGVVTSGAEAPPPPPPPIMPPPAPGPDPQPAMVPPPPPACPPAPATPAIVEPSGVRHPVAGRCTTVGSAGDNDIVLAAQGISRHHARIFREPDGRLWIEDLASTNGVWLDGQRVAKAWLEDGGELVLGAWRARVSA